MNPLKKITLGQKLMWGGGMIVLLLIMIVLMVYHEMNVLDDYVNEEKMSSKVLNKAILLSAEQQKLDKIVLQYASFSDPKLVEEMNKRWTRNDEYRRDLGEWTRLPEVIQALNAYERLIGPLKESQKAFTAAIDAKVNPEEIHTMLAERGKLEEEAQAYLNTVVNIENNANDRAMDEGKQHRDALKKKIYLFIGITLLLASVLLIVLFLTTVPVMREAMTQIAFSTNQLQITAQEQSSGATEQSSTIAEVTSTMEELAQTASRIATNAQTLAHAVDASLKGMQLINEKVDAMAKRMMSLGEKSQSIGNITKIIDELAGQANLLALNASIEAARAGEGGRAFAIVASEVRKLAERSNESTQDIRNLITEIQGETNAVIMGVEDSTKTAAKGLEQINQTVSVIKEITLATQQQKSASDQITQAMRNIDEVVKQFATSSKQTAAAVEQLNRLSGQVKVMVGGFKGNYRGM
ncbi:MAG: methyl-accepting chemotaxis protein [Chlamydiae bacterium]|nr:methyl-accepting chemotaxis protein [Chlamydiota bacterium]MBI3276709.1 methyl-accepting chemotaxis protein [Chlamydiota bacterium]